MIRRLSTLAILGAAVGGPYVASETEMGRSAMSTLTSAIGDSETSLVSLTGDGSGGGELGPHAHYQVETLRNHQPSRFRYSRRPSVAATESKDLPEPELAGTRVSDLREVVRFDITPNWVIQRFSRVTTVLADLQMEGMRVPIVTGVRPDDLAGTLTYYFDSRDKLQRVTVHGFTGDPRRLVGTLTSHFGLTAEPSLEAGVFTKRWNGQPVSFLRLTHAPVVHADAIHQKYTLFLELNDPNLAFGISREARKIVDSDRLSGRW